MPMMFNGLPFVDHGEAHTFGSDGSGGGGGGASCPVPPAGCINGGGSGLPAPGSAGPNWDGNCSCLSEDCEVLLDDRKSVLARDIRVGDRLLGVDKNDVANPQQVVHIGTSEQPCLEIRHELGAFTCSITHPLFLSDRSIALAGDIDMRSNLLLSDEGAAVRIIDIVDVGIKKVCAWRCDPDHTFVASRVLHHNKALAYSNRVIQQ